MANTYYISATGDDRNNGFNEAQAFRTFQKVERVLQGGDTVYVMNGTYTRTDDLSKSVFTIYEKQGTAAQPTTIKAYPGHNPVIQSSNTYAINLAGSSHVVIEGLTLIGNKDSITLEYAQSQQLVTNNPLTRGSAIRIGASSYVNGIPTNYSNSIVIRDNTISKFSGGGIGTDLADYVTIENNTISETSWYTNNGTSPISIFHSRDSDSNTTDYKMIVRGNVIYDNQSLIPWIGAGRITEGHGIIIDDNRNTQASSAIQGQAYQGKILVNNNIVYNNGGFGVNVFQSENVDVVNNTLYQNSRNPDLNGEIAVVNSNNVRAENNIMSARDGRRANTIYQSTNVIFDHNLSYNSSSAFQAASPPNAVLGGSALFVDPAATYTQTANLLNAGLQNIVGQDPLFVDAVNGNFTLQAGSSAIDAASDRFSSAAGTDFLGANRFYDGDGINGVQFDLGAYEYRGTPTLTPAILFISAIDTVKLEGNTSTTPLTFIISRAGNTTSAVSVDYTLTGSGFRFANAADFGGAFPIGTVNFAANQTSKVITINVNGDTTPEPDEGFTVTLSNPSSGGAIGTATARGIIQNDDSATLQITSANANKAEGDAGTTSYTFNVVRSGDTTGATDVNFTVTGSGANPANADDFGGAFPTGTVSFLANETSKVITINVSGDTINEPDEGFTVTLSGAIGGATITIAGAGGTIRNDDTRPTVAITATDTNAAEARFDPAQFTITRTGSTVDPLTVNYTIVGTATNGTDYASITGTATIAAGASSTTVTITPTDDALVESNETVVLNLTSNAVYKLGVTTTATVTIADREIVKPTMLAIASTDAIKTEGNIGSIFYTFTVTRSGDTTGATDVDFAITGVGSNPGNAEDFGGIFPTGSVNFAANESSKIITVNVIGDITVEPDEGFTVTLSNPSGGAILSTTTATGTIQNDDVVAPLPNESPTLNPTLAIPDLSPVINSSFSYTFDASTFIDPDGDPLTYEATLADGNSLPTWLTFDPITRTLSGIPSNTDVGTLTIDLTASDGNGGSIKDTFTLSVAPLPNESPILNPTLAIPDLSPVINSSFSYTFDASTFIDPDGDPLTYEATLADGNSLPTWLTFDPITRTLSGIPSNTDVGTLTIDLTASDGNGGSIKDTFTLSIAPLPNESPTLNPTLAIPDLSPVINSSFSYTFDASTFIDPDGDPLTYEATLADGNSLPTWLTFDPITRTLSGIPSNTDVGTLTIDLTASDGNGGSIKDTFTLSIAPLPNESPTLNPTLAIPDLSPVINSSFSYTFDANTFIDPDGDPLTYEATLADGNSLPTWLTFDLITRTLSGIPSNTDVGTLTIDLTASDGNGGSIKDTFTLSIAPLPNESPTLNPTLAIPDLSPVINSSFSYTFDANTFIDPDGDPLTYEATLADGNSLPTWLTFDPITRTLSGIPSNTDVGTLTIDLTASDGNGGSIKDTFTLSIAPLPNESPTLNPTLAIPDLSPVINSSFSYTFDANTFIDPDGDPLTYEATLADGNSLPTWLTFDLITRTLSGIPSNTDVGTLTIDLTASDGNGGSIKDTFTLSIAPLPNESPTLNPTLAIPDLSPVINSSFSYTFDANTFIDPDGDPLTYEATLADGNSLPTWLTFDLITRTLSGIPSNTDVGTLTIDLTASDGNGGSIKDTFTLSVAPLLTILNGTDSSETLFGTTPANQIYGFGGQDLITGHTGDDQIWGGEGNDRLWGHEGNDLLYGEVGNDQLWGDEGDDRLFGGLGDDQLYGGVGKDWLTGSEGKDVLTGGYDADIFVLAHGQGTDSIRDFEVGTDFIALLGGLVFGQLSMQQRGSQAWVIDSSENQVLARLDGVSASTLLAQASTTFFTI